MFYFNRSEAIQAIDIIITSGYMKIIYQYLNCREIYEDMIDHLSYIAVCTQLKVAEHSYRYLCFI